MKLICLVPVAAPSAGVRDGRRRGFTLIELLVVIAIITLLLAVLIPSLAAARRQSRKTVCLAHLRQIGTAMTNYRAVYKGWLPVGPAEKLIYRDRVTFDYHRDPGPNRDIFPIENCHWGGRRAKWVHRWDAQGIPPIPETMKRPLTDFLYRGTSLDQPTPLFECPADVGIPDWLAEEQPDSAPLGPDQPYYEVCGNSYRVNPWVPPWEDLIGVPRRRVRTPSEIILAQDASLDNGMWRFKLVPGWHGAMGMHNLLFLDGHAEFRFIDTRQHHGPGWYTVNYFELVRYHY